MKISIPGIHQDLGDLGEVVVIKNGRIVGVFSATTSKLVAIGLARESDDDDRSDNPYSITLFGVTAPCA